MLCFCRGKLFLYFWMQVCRCTGIQIYRYTDIRFKILQAAGQQKYGHFSPEYMNYIQKRIQSFGYACKGLRTLFSETPNALIQLIAAIAAVILGFVLHISKGEWLAVIIVIGLVLALEAINSALETLADYACNREIHPLIRKVKDLAAAGVLIAALAALVVGIVVFLPKIIEIIP